MRRRGPVVLSALALLAWVACSDGPSAPEPPGGDALSPVILSDPLDPTPAPALAAAAGRGLAGVTFVSLPPGSVPGAASVSIRNVTAGGDPTAAPVVGGGFDPVAIDAAAGDSLELEFRDSGGTVLERKAGRVPARRPPVIVRTSPPEGRTDVALGIRPTIVFSEPVDPTTIGGAVRLLQGTAAVVGEVLPAPDQPWVVQFIPSAVLEPATEYHLEVGRELLDADGDALPEAHTVSFRTIPASEPPPPVVSQRIAFVSNRSGAPRIYLANSDGSGVVDLTAGDSPAWSGDGRRIAFSRGYDIYVINADGSGERLVATGASNGGPSWSPDDSQFALAGDRGIYTLGADGSGETVLYRPPDPYFGWGGPQWSPDGRSIAFEVQRGGDYYLRQVMVLELGNPEPAFLTGEDPARSGQRSPAWSADGMRLAFVVDSGTPSTGVRIGYALASLPRDGGGEPTIHIRSDDIPGIWTEWYAGPVDEPAWAPAGSQLAFVVTRIIQWEDIATRIHVVDIEAGHQRQLIADIPGRSSIEYSDWGVVWSPLSP